MYSVILTRQFSGYRAFSELPYRPKGVFSSYPSGSDDKESAYNARDPGSIPGLGRSPGGGNGNTLQYSCLENFMDRRDWRAIVHGIAESQTPLSN